ncbi:MAG TPA: nuclear transport factor 2 family protein [Candidatus Acidoferrum sp.]|nr:nuclear transport factor 2 family protein [Candidatus Acidoferrum sp.]
MQRLAPTLALSLFLLFNLSTSAQENKVPDDSSAVRATVTNYIEAYYTGDARRMEQTLDPHYLKHILHGNIPMREKTAPEMLEEVRTHGIPDIPQTQRTEQVIVLDVAGNIASAKLVTPGWMDYVTLAKSGGEWKILSIVQRIDN